ESGHRITTGIRRASRSFSRQRRAGRTAPQYATACAAEPVPIESPMSLTSPYLLPILLLLGSNIFMTLAWYGHLRFKEQPLLIVIFVAWGIAFIEYCMAVPANRWGSEVYTTAQLKTMQEVITLIVFAGFSV